MVVAKKLKKAARVVTISLSLRLFYDCEEMAEVERLLLSLYGEEKCSVVYHAEENPSRWSSKDEHMLSRAFACKLFLFRSPT